MKNWTMQEIKYKNAYELYMRKENFRDFYYYYEDITRVVRGYPNVHFRHLIAPLDKLESESYIPIFDGVETVRKLLEMGYRDTEENLSYYFEMFPEHSANYTASEHPTV